MTAAETRRALLIALFLMALGGLLLHLRIHPIWAPDKANPGATVFRPAFIPATLLPLLDVFLVTLLFTTRKTAVWGHLLNGLIVIYGTVLMGHYSIAGLLPKDPAPLDWILRSTFPDIALAWADFAVGAVLYRSWISGD